MQNRHDLSAKERAPHKGRHSAHRNVWMDFLRVDEVAAELDVSKPYAYKLIRQLNEELKSKGYLTIAGRVNRQYFMERLYGGKDVE